MTPGVFGLICCVSIVIFCFGILLISFFSVVPICGKCGLVEPCGCDDTMQSEWYLQTESTKKVKV